MPPRCTRQETPPPVAASRCLRLTSISLKKFLANFRFSYGDPQAGSQTAGKGRQDLGIHPFCGEYRIFCNAAPSCDWHFCQMQTQSPKHRLREFRRLETYSSISQRGRRMTAPHLSPILVRCSPPPSFTSDASQDRPPNVIWVSHFWQVWPIVETGLMMPFQQSTERWIPHMQGRPLTDRFSTTNTLVAFCVVKGANNAAEF
jgi:hypothetical protein